MNFTIEYMNPLGTYDQKYGQRYYGKLKDVAMDASFNLMNPVNFSEGDVIECDERVIKQKGPQTKNPGEDYIFLKKVKPLGGQTEVPTPSASGKEGMKNPAAVPSSDKAYLRDASTIPLDVYRVRANINGLPTNSEERRIFFENVMEDSEELLNLVDKIRNPGLGAQFRKIQADKENKEPEDWTQGLEEES